jgi:hypothetical protein
MYLGCTPIMQNTLRACSSEGWPTPAGWADGMNIPAWCCIVDYSGGIEVDKGERLMSTASAQGMPMLQTIRLLASQEVKVRHG